MIASKCCPGVFLCLTSVVSALVRRPTLTRSTPFMSCVCHPSVAASRCRVVVDSALLTVLSILFWDSLKPVTGNSSYYFQYQGVVGCVRMLNYCFSNNDEVCADNYNYSRFKLTDKCRSEKWEVYLYGYSRFKLKGQCRSEKWEVFLYGDFRFKLTDKCRSEKWEVYLYGDFPSWWTVVVWKCCPGVCLRLGFHPIWQRITPSLSCAAF